MNKFTAPEHTTSIQLSTGRVLSVDAKGILTAPDDLSDAERATLTREGFVPIPDEQAFVIEPPVKVDEPKTPIKTQKA